MSLFNLALSLNLYQYTSKVTIHLHFQFVTCGKCTPCRYFVQGAVDVYDCTIVSVLDSIFMHNGPVSHTLKSQPFRGNSGGLSIAYNNVTSSGVKLSVFVERCIFINNSALPDLQLQLTSSLAVSSKTFTGRGGALGLLLSNELQHIEVLVRGCQFHGNSAQNFGGGMYVLFDVDSGHTVTISECYFGINAVPYFAGGLFTAFIGQGSVSKHSVQIVTDCSFFQNRAMQGGAAVVILSASLGKYLLNNCSRLPTCYTHAGWGNQVCGMWYL